MVIAVNIPLLPKDKGEGKSDFIRDVLQRIAWQHPEHRFYFFSNHPLGPEGMASPNITPLVMDSGEWWYAVKVFLALRRIKADVFVSPAGFCCLTTGVPQCLLVQDLTFLQQQKLYKKAGMLFNKYYLQKILKKAKTIVTFTAFAKQELTAACHLPEDKICVVPYEVNERFQPTSYEQQAAIKEEHTGGKEYFIYIGAIHPHKNLVNLLKAFSIFKKRQKSSMKLVLTGPMVWPKQGFVTLLKTYKYRDDVVWLDETEKQVLAGLLAAAYALVYPSLFEGFGIPVAEAMQCGVPVLTSRHPALEEISGGAALYFDTTSVTEIAESLMKIYKDETLRATLVENGKAVVQKYTGDAAAGALWCCIERAVKG